MHITVWFHCMNNITSGLNAYSVSMFQFFIYCVCILGVLALEG